MVMASVYAIDPRYIDPRRPKKTKLSAQEMEERLLPYQDTLPVNSLSFVTYDKQKRNSIACQTASLMGPLARIHARTPDSKLMPGALSHANNV
eukprot:scaffold140015_cov21-Tisochrysis_lutea.AAC.1